MKSGFVKPEEIDEETWQKILQLRDIIDPNLSVVEALDIAFIRTRALVKFSTKRYGLPPLEAIERFWEEVKELEARAQELEEEVEDQKMLRESLRKRLLILRGYH